MAAQEGGIDDELLKQLAVTDAKGLQLIKTAGQTSARGRGYMEAIAEAIKTAPQGMMDINAHIASLIPGWDPAADILKSMADRAAPSTRVLSSGSTSDIEHKGMMNSFPSLRKSPKANYIIAQMYLNIDDIAQKKVHLINAFGSRQITSAEMWAGLEAVDKESVLIDKKTGKSLLDLLDKDTKAEVKDSMSKASAEDDLGAPILEDQEGQ